MGLHVMVARTPGGRCGRISAAVGTGAVVLQSPGMGMAEARGGHS